MITDITLKFGKAPGLQPEPIKLTPITVFVGPNNSGKSKILAEIRRFCSSQQRFNNDVILGNIKIQPLPPQEIEETIRRFTFNPGPQQPIGARQIAYGRPDRQWSVVNMDELANNLRSPETDAFRYYYLALETLMLDGPGRVQLINM